MPSLKQFHIFFIATSIALTLGFGVWGLMNNMALGLASFAACGLLVAYLCKVVSKI